MEQDELHQRRSELRTKIATLEWDKDHRQINFAKKMMLTKYKEEMDSIEVQLKGTDTPKEDMPASEL
jgi:hypothetical protein